MVFVDGEQEVSDHLPDLRIEVGQRCEMFQALDGAGIGLGETATLEKFTREDAGSATGTDTRHAVVPGEASRLRTSDLLRVGSVPGGV